MYQDKKIIHIVARGLNGEIGANNKLLWSIPEDLQFFKESTLGHVVLMGRNTIESLPTTLENRITITVSSKNYPLYDLSGEEQITWSLDDAHSHSEYLNSDKIFIAGGAKLYNSTFDITDELWITQVDDEYPQADTFYNIPKNFKLIDEVYGDCCKDVGYSFQKWVKV